MFCCTNEGLRSFLRRRIPPLYCIWYGERKDTWIKTRLLLSALAGLFLPCLIARMLMLSFTFSHQTRNTIMWTIAIPIAVGYVFTDSVKCLTLLTFVAMLGRTGRGFLRGQCFAFILAGPFSNLVLNVGEVVRVFSCSTALSYNLTRTRFDLLTKPFQRTAAHMKDDVKEVEQIFNNLKNVTKTIHVEVLADDPEISEFDDTISTNTPETVIHDTDSSVITSTEENHNSYDKIENTFDVITPKIIENETSFYEKFIDSYDLDMLLKNFNKFAKRQDATNAQNVQERYKNKMRKRCVLQLETGKNRCKTAFRDMLDKCNNKLPIIIRSLLCLPFRASFICHLNILGNPEKLCDPSDAIPDNFGNTYVELVDMENKLYDDSSNVSVEYNISSIESNPAYQTAKETAASVMYDFDARKRVFASIIRMTRQVLAFLVFRLFVACFNYHSSYKSNFDFDNVYITDYFKHVDRRQKAACKRTLLPLKKYELKDVVDVNDSRQTKQESREMNYQTVYILLEIFSVGFFLILDFFLITLLDVVRVNSEVTFVQEGEHNIQFKVEGSGLIARLIRTTMQNFNMHERVYTTLTNKQCLPNPYILPERFYKDLLTLYVLVLVLVYNGSTIMRMRRKICAYFYRKREKRRILYLYNKIMKQRRTLTRKMLKEAEQNIFKSRVRLKSNLILRLRLSSLHFDWLKNFKYGCRTCVCCDEFETESFVICTNRECGMAYCFECWRDMENNCLACNTLIAEHRILNFDQFFEEFYFSNV